MEVAQTPNREIPLYLPPRDVWRFIPGKDEPLETPLDAYGLVDVDALIALLKSTVDPDFTWDPSEKPDIHHLFWPHNLFAELPDAEVNPNEFYALPINQIIIPRMAHNWSHIVTKGPPVPKPEIMKRRIEMYHIVRRLFRSARLSIALTEAPYMPEEKLLRGSEHLLWEFLLEAEEAKKIPEEFHIIGLEELNPSTIEDLRSLASFLGRAVTRTNRARDIRRTVTPTAASATLVT